MSRGRLLGTSLAGLFVAAAALAAVRRRLVVVEVSGASMSPTYESGDRVLVLRKALSGIRRGQVVVVEGPVDPDRPGWAGLPPLDGDPRGRRWFIKRAAALPGDTIPRQVVPAVSGSPGDRVPGGKLVVLGDSRQSVDSRTLGYFPGERLLGVVLRKVR